MPNKNLLLIGAIGYSILLFILSFINFDEFPKLGSENDDKILHIFAYIVFVIIWYYTLFSLLVEQVFLKVILGAFIYGIIIEVLQGILSTHRQFEISDLLANGIGIAIAVLIIKAIQRLIVKKI